MTSACSNAIEGENDAPASISCSNLQPAGQPAGVAINLITLDAGISLTSVSSSFDGRSAIHTQSCTRLVSGAVSPLARVVGYCLALSMGCRPNQREAVCCGGFSWHEPQRCSGATPGFPDFAQEPPSVLSKTGRSQASEAQPYPLSNGTTLTENDMLQGLLDGRTKVLTP